MQHRHHQGHQRSQGRPEVEVRRVEFVDGVGKSRTGSNLAFEKINFEDKKPFNLLNLEFRKILIFIDASFFLTIVAVTVEPRIKELRKFGPVSFLFLGDRKYINIHGLGPYLCPSDRSVFKVPS